MTTVYCQMLGDAIPADICSSEQGHRGCKNCKASTRKCEKCKKNSVAKAVDGLCDECVCPVAVVVEVSKVETKSSSLDMLPTENMGTNSVVVPSPPRRLTLMEKIRGVHETRNTTRSRLNTDVSSGTTYSAMDGVRLVVYFTPAEFAVWNWVTAERQVDNPEAEILLPQGPRGLKRSEMQEPISFTTDEYWDVVAKFEQMGLLRHIRTVGERLSFYQALFNPARYHVVRIATRVKLLLEPLHQDLIAAVQADEIDIPEYDAVAVEIRDWIMERFPELDAVKMRAKLVGFVSSRTYQSWGILYLHGRSRRCLVCKKGFEPYIFHLRDAF